MEMYRVPGRIECVGCVCRSGVSGCSKSGIRADDFGH